MKISLRKLLITSCVAFGVIASSAGRSLADTVAYTTSGTESDLANYGLAGFEFTLDANINVTQLGFTAISLGGGDQPQVTLWNATQGLGSLQEIYSTGNIINDITFPTPGPGSGTIAPTYVSVGTPIALTAGNTYLVTAPGYWVPTYDSTDILTNSTVFSSSTFLQSGESFFGGGGWNNSGYNFSGLTDAPSSQVPTTANFKFTPGASLPGPGATPEPSSYLLLGIALLVLALVRRRAGKTTL